MKFVIHHHVTSPPHYDLMVEKDNVLHTWQISENSFQNFIDGKSINVTMIQDHRKKYLDYEGPISCDRGTVKIFDTGEYVEISWNKDIIVQINGKLLNGKLSLLFNCDKYFLLKYDNK